MFRKKIQKFNKYFFVLVILISFFSFLPFFNPGFFKIHDDTQMARVIVMGKALKEGQFPVRWVSDLGYGYGYPIYNFYAPLPYYLGGILYAIGIDSLLSAKVMMIFGIILSGVTIFLVTKKLLGLIPAFVASTFYLYAPYKAVQIYIRGSVGEFWALIFLPLIYLSQIMINRNEKPKMYALLGGLSMAALILSHNIISYIVFVSFILINLILFARLFIKNNNYYRKFLIYIGITISIGLGVSCFFWLPALYEIKFTRVYGFLWDQTKYWEHYVCLNQLWDSAWGFAGSAMGCIDGMSFKLGKIHIIAVFISLLLYIKNRNDKKASIYLISLMLLLVSIFMTHNASKVFWDVIPMSMYIQYPWRFLTFSIFFMSILAGFCIYFVKNNKYQVLASLLMIIICMVINVKLFKPQSYYIFNNDEYENPKELSYRISKISDEYMTSNIKIPINESDIVHGTISSTNTIFINPVKTSSIYEKYSYKNLVKQKIILNKMYFPGWMYLINGKTVNPKIVNGLPEISLNQGEGIIELTFQNTVIREIGNLISLITLLLILYFYDKKTIN